MPIPWFYTWSEHVFHHVLQDTLKEFDLKPIQSETTTIKHRAELIVKALKDTTAPYIIFSVSDIIVKPGFINELSEVTDDMIFLDGPKGTFEPAILYLKNTSDVREFWSSVTTIEESILGFKGKWSKFSKKCVSTDTWDKASEFSILYLISSGFGKEFDFAEKIFTMAQYIELQPYMQYVPEDIVPFIYKIQELLFLTHKEMKKAS
jgi:hypothetical protein